MVKSSLAVLGRWLLRKPLSRPTSDARPRTATSTSAPPGESPPKTRAMKWFRRKKKSQSLDSDGYFNISNNHNQNQNINHPPLRHDPARRHYPEPRPTTSSADCIARLPAPLLERIFAFVCPHAHDETYETCENSAVDDACMLCDLRDLAHCAQVSRRWRKLAANVLYHSIRIDTVHYCEREDILAEKRKRSFMNRNAEPEDTPAARLRLLCRTLRDDETGLGQKVRFIKTPYMTRETSKADLARMVAVTPYLRYIDLPEGVFTDDPSCHALKQELQGRCLDLRKMSYMGGAERSLELLARGVWRNLEVLELSRLNMDPTILRTALGSLPSLRALKVSDMKTFDDQLFRHSDYLPPWPALDELVFSNVPNLTADGLVAYLERPDTQETLAKLSLTETGVHPSMLQRIVMYAPNLKRLSIIEAVATSFPAGVPPLASSSLETLNYEITSAESAGTYSNTTASYYAYLTSSLISNGLPGLRNLYVRDPNFPESLIDLAPPAPAFAFDADLNPPAPRITSHSSGGSSTSPLLTPHSTGSARFPGHAHNLSNGSRLSSNNPFLSPPGAAHGAPPAMARPHLGLRSPLQVFSKGLDEMEWSFSRVQPGGAGRRGSATALRPVSSSGLDDPVARSSWGGARSSVIVGNGFGGFLAVPADEVAGRPRSAGGERARRGSQYDMWR